jgi:EVE domain
MNGHWIAVASAEHVRRGRTEGFMQVCHGKLGPLRRISAGDRVAYYSPTVTFGGDDRLQAFTAIGTVRAGGPYPHEMAGGGRVYRLDVAWDQAEEAPITPLLEAMDFTAGRRNWGYQLRFGLFGIGARDFHLIAAAMGAPTGDRAAHHR